MATDLPLGPLDFLQGAPAPSSSVALSVEDPADRLPQAAIDRVMKLRGVDGVWVERDARGGRVVVLHYTPKGSAPHLPNMVNGLPTRIVGGEPINAGL
ncbi:MAG: hypothetical protein LH480_15500 [Rubrivivax sp.]|nr:hypothetical protein [Rubrivivax sp.]